MMRRSKAWAEVVRPPAPDADDAITSTCIQNYEIEAERRDGLREFLAARDIGTLLPWGGKAVHQWEALGFEVRLPATESVVRAGAAAADASVADG